MFNLRQNAARQLGRVIAMTAMALLVSSSAVFAQATGTSTVRGTVEDSSGGVLPGATVTLTNVGTKAVATSVTDGRGGYLAVVFPGVYDLKVELEGFKTYEQKAISISPADTRGIDVKLEVGAQSETVTVTATTEVIQTETGAREGVLTAAQIDNLSVIGRSSLELLRILPGVVTPDSSAFESVSFGGGANNTNVYSVNGIRGSNNTVSLDGSSLIDIGSNSGLMVTLNNDMVQEVKVQSSNFAAEYGAGGMSISAVTKAGSSTYSGTIYDYNRNHRFAANDRSNSIAGVDKPKSKFNYAGGNVGGPIPLFGTDYNTNKDKLFFFFGLEVQRQQVDPGTRFSVVPTVKQRAGDFSEFLTPNGQNLGQNVGPVLIPRGFPGEGTAAPGANLNPYTHPLGRVLTNLYPLPTGSYQNNRYNYALTQLEPTDRLDMKARFDWNVSNNTKAYVRIARESEDVETARGVWWGASDVALPTPNLGTNNGKSVSGNIVTVLSPTMTNEALVSWSRLELDNQYVDPSKMQLATYGVEFKGPFPGASPYVPGVIPNWGGNVGNLWSSANDMYAHNDELTFSNKLTKIAGAHGLKFGVSLARLQKQQNFNADEEGYVVFAPAWQPGTTSNTVGDMMAGVITQFQQGSDPPEGEFRMWNFDAFAQDSWKLRSNLTLEYGARFGYWPNNRSLLGQGAYFDPTLYDPTKRAYLDQGTFQHLNGYRYVSDGTAPEGILENRSPFVLPRVNMAWDIDGEGNNVLRGGYGLFFNRNMGNVEYDSALRVPPQLYQINQETWGGYNYAYEGRTVGLTYDTLNQAYADRINTVGPNTITQDSWKFPTTHSFSVSFARRIPFNQVVEAAYVGTRGRNLVSIININTVPQGALLSGRVGNADLSIPVNRVALDGAAINSFRPYQAFGRMRQYDYEGESEYNSLQLTLSRQTGKRLQYFVAYTFGRTEGDLGDEYRDRDPFDRSRTYGVRAEDRTHTLNVSWNAFLPDGAKGPIDNKVGRGLLNGWQLSGISTVASGTPIWLGFTGNAGSAGISQGYYGTGDTVLLTGPGIQTIGGLAPVYTCDPRTGNTKPGEKYLDINCITFPAFGQNGEVKPPYNIRTPTRQNHDITVFKNFALRGNQKLQVRAGFFNIFNQAFPTINVTRDDLVLTMNTVCNRTVDNVPNGVGGTANGVCDPTGGFSFTQDTKDNFGKVNLLRGHRVIEFALKYYF